MGTASSFDVCGDRVVGESAVRPCLGTDGGEENEGYVCDVLRVSDGVETIC